MGVPIQDRETHESHVDELTDKVQEVLKKKKVILVFVCFNKQNEEKTHEKLKKLGIESVEIKFGFDMTEKVFSDASKVFSDVKQKQVVQKYLSDIGREILYSAKSNKDGSLKENWSDERVEEGKLGYNDAQQLVILKSNVPTYTITPIWLAGKYKNRDWLPLFDRTEKTSTNNIQLSSE